jgi:hypothetical protein
VSYYDPHLEAAAIEGGGGRTASFRSQHILDEQFVGIVEVDAGVSEAPHVHACLADQNGHAIDALLQLLTIYRMLHRLCQAKRAGLAHLGERMTEDHEVVGSKPTSGTFFFHFFTFSSFSSLAANHYRYLAVLTVL